MSGSGWLRRCSLYNLNGEDFRGGIDGPAVVRSKFEIAAAKKVPGLDAAGRAKSAAIDCDNAGGAVRTIGRELCFGVAPQDECVGGLLRKHQHPVAWAEGS